MSIWTNPDDNQLGTASAGAVYSDHFVSGIENQLMDLIQLVIFGNH
jgi:hypothetical protein